MRKTANQGLAIKFLEFVEFGAVDHARDDVADVIGLAPVGGDTHAVLGMSAVRIPPPRRDARRGAARLHQRVDDFVPMA